MDKKTIDREELRQKAMLDAIQECEPEEKLNEFYKSPEWRKLKKEYMNLYPLCELCLHEGKETASQVVHHIEPISQGGSKLSEDNLIALCRECHEDVHRYGPAITLSVEMLPSVSKQTEILADDIKWLSGRPFILPPERGKTRLAGITEKNFDGTDRQTIIAKCMKGEPLKLVREPQNPQNNVLIGVFRESGEQIGYIDDKIARYSYLADDMDHGCAVTAMVLEIDGQPGNQDCVIEITREKRDWEKTNQFDELLRKGKDAEKKHILWQWPIQIKLYPYFGRPCISMRNLTNFA